MTSFHGCRLLRAAGSACLIAAAATAAAADPLARVNLRWQAPASSCPDVTALESQLRRDLQGSQASEPLDVDARVEPVGESGWAVSIHTRSAAGQSDRSLAARSCQALADATSLILAMQIDPETAATHARAIEGLSEPTLSDVPPASESPALPLLERGASKAGLVQPPQPTRASSTRPSTASGTKTSPQDLPSNRAPTGVDVAQRWRAVLSAIGMRDWGTLPSGTEMFGGSVGLRRALWQGEASLGILVRQDLLPGAGPPVGKLGILTGGFRVCRQVWAQSRFAFGPCVGIEWARWSSEGNRNLASQRSEAVTTAGIEGRLAGTLKLFEALDLLVPLDVVVPLNRPSFGFTQNSERQVVVFEPFWIAVRVGAGLQLIFP